MSDSRIKISLVYDERSSCQQLRSQMATFLKRQGYRSVAPGKRDWGDGSITTKYRHSRGKLIIRSVHQKEDRLVNLELDGPVTEGLENWLEERKA